MTTAVLVATSCPSLPDSERRTGVSLPQFGVIRRALSACRWQLILASPSGGDVPVDAGTWSEEWAGAATALAGSAALGELGDTGADVWIVLGGHGALVDLAEDAVLAALLARALRDGAMVVGIDHGAAALATVRHQDGAPWLAGRRVTGRSDAEERFTRHLGIAGRSTEQRLRAAGARYTAGPPWTAHAVADGHIVTAQNPASITSALQALLDTNPRGLEAA
jgi:putative intracellular protease/amidase